MPPSLAIRGCACACHACLQDVLDVYSSVMDFANVAAAMHILNAAMLVGVRHAGVLQNKRINSVTQQPLDCRHTAWACACPCSC